MHQSLTPKLSINLFNSGTTSTTGCCATETSARHSTFRHPTTTCSLVDLHHDRINHTLELFLLRLEFIFLSELIFVKPIERVLHRLFNFVFVVTLEFVFQLLFLQRVPHGEAVILQTVFGFNLAFVLLVFSSVLLRFLYHTVNLGLRQTTLFICDRDLVRLARRLVLCRYIQNAIRVDVESHLNLRNAAWSWWDPM